LGYGLEWAQGIIITWGPDSPCECAIVGGKAMPGHARRHSAVSCAKIAEPIDMRFGLWTRLGRRKHKFNRIRQVAPSWEGIFAQPGEHDWTQSVR